MLLYAFDLRIKGDKAYNTLKRRFYYSLGKSELSNPDWRTKSVLLVDELLENKADAFFSQWKEHIVVYKARVLDLEQLF